MGIQEFATLHQSPEKIVPIFCRILTQERSTPHPLKQLIIILVLFGSWNNFLKQYLAFENSSSPKITNSEEEPSEAQHLNGDSTRPGKHAEFIEALKTSNSSIHAAAKQIGISTSTGMAWAAAANITVKRRAKILKPELRLQLIRALRRGISKAAAASAFGVSIQTVTTTLRTEIGLHMRWTQARFKLAQKEARLSWKRTASKLPAPTIKLVRALQPAAYAWLYRHDRAWLDSVSATFHKTTRSNHANINWDERDSELSNTINKSALAWHEQHLKGYLTNARLCQLVPALKSKLSELDKMPLTRETLARIQRKSGGYDIPQQSLDYLVDF